MSTAWEARVIISTVSTGDEANNTRCVEIKVWQPKVIWHIPFILGGSSACRAHSPARRNQHRIAWGKYFH